MQGVWRSGSGAEFKVWVFPATKGLEIESEVDVGVWGWGPCGVPVSQEVAKRTTSPGVSGLARWHSPQSLSLFFKIFI